MPCEIGAEIAVEHAVGILVAADIAAAGHIEQHRQPPSLRLVNIELLPRIGAVGDVRAQGDAFAPLRDDAPMTLIFSATPGGNEPSITDPPVALRAIIGDRSGSFHRDVAVDLV
ncbi:MAG: hypothetical protein ACREFQ_10500 [Stellaceae bacterium]